MSEPSLIGRILPAGVVAVEAFTDASGAVLFPEEAALLAKASAKRRDEFATVRGCARQALAALGIAPVPLLPGRAGAPSWPSGVVGSMTHCDGYRSAALAPARHFTTIGVDAELALPLPQGVLGLIASDPDCVSLEELAAADPAVCWDRLLFCAKEALYKAWYPVTGQWLNFRDATVEIGRDGGFVARAKSRTFRGRWLSDRGLLLAAIAEPA